MMKSMTGYGRARGMTRLGEVHIELRGVNGRHLDLKVRTPRYLFVMEPYLQSALKERLARGRIECTLSVDAANAQLVHLKVNESLAEAYLRAGKELKEKFDLSGGGSVEFLMRLPDVVSQEDPEVDSEEVWKDLQPILAQALDSFVDMRSREGKKLEADFNTRLDNLTRFLQKLEQHVDDMVQTYRERLTNRMRDLFAEMNLDENRIAQEAALLAERSDVTEEIVRLRSHLEHFSTLMGRKEPPGRKLDFLLQEMLREINTIGSKTDVLEATRLVLEMKNEVEKMREQVMNVE